VVFNPNIPDQAENFTSASRGVEADTSLGGLFGSIGTIATEAVGAADKLFKSVIREDATQGVDQLRDREINQGAQGAFGGTPPPGVKSAIDQNIERVGIAKNAAETGQIGDSHYYLLLDAEARRLRSRYPGHREYIDNVIHDLTGTTPANRAIELMKAESKKENTQLDNEYHWAREHGGPGQEAIARGEKPTLEQMRTWNYTHAKRLSDNKLIDSNVKTEEAVRKVEKDRNFDSYNNNFLATLDDSGRAALSNAGVTLDAINKEKSNFDEQAAKGPVDAKTAARLSQLTTQYREQKMKEFDDYVGQVRENNKGEKFTVAGLIGPDYVEKMRKSVVEKLDAQTKPITDQDKGRLHYQVVANEATSNEEIGKLYNSSDQIRRMAATHKVLGDQVSNTLLWSSTPGMSAVKAWFSSYIVGGLSTGKSIDNLFEEGASNMDKAGLAKEDQAHVNRDVITKLSTNLRNKNLTPEGANMIVNSLFSGDPRAKDFYAKASDERPSIGMPSDREVLYNKLVHPEITAAIFRTGNSQTISKYTQWVDAATGQRIAQEATNIKATFVDNFTGYRINYDPKTFKFTPELMDKGNTGVQAAEARAYQITSKLNNTVSHFVPVAQQLKMTPDDINYKLEQYFQIQGLDINNMGPKNIPSNLVRPTLRRDPFLRQEGQ
jgi:hypothetical protein